MPHSKYIFSACEFFFMAMESERPPLWQRKQVRPYDRLRRPLPPATLRRILEKNGLREGHHYAVVSHQELTGKKTPGWGMGRTFWNVVAGGMMSAIHLPFFEVIKSIYEDVERRELLKLKEKPARAGANN